MTAIQQAIEETRITSLRKQHIDVFNKLNSLCKEESDLDIFEFLKMYDILTEDSFSNVYKVIYK
jgi:hypothetical protein